MTEFFEVSDINDLIQRMLAYIKAKRYEECFKWAVNAALCHKDTRNHPERISSLEHYENQYNWEGLEFPVSIKKIDKFEKNNPGIAVNVLFSNKKNQNIYTARRSGRNLSVKSRLTY